MMPSRNAVPSAVPAFGSAVDTPLRLRLDPNGSPEPYLDGAWWPRSAELAAELPALLTALSPHLGPIVLIGYRRGAWTEVPGHLDLAGHAVHLQGFVSRHPPTLVVVDDAGQRVTLRVVPPETDRATAAMVMAAATDHHAAKHGGGVVVTEAARAEIASLDEVAARLARLPGNRDPDQSALISQWVTEAAEQFRDAPIQAFVPILVEHIVRGRLYSDRA